MKALQDLDFQLNMMNKKGQLYVCLRFGVTTGKSNYLPEPEEPWDDSSEAMYYSLSINRPSYKHNQRTNVTYVWL